MSTSLSVNLPPPRTIAGQALVGLAALHGHRLHARVHLRDLEEEVRAARDEAQSVGAQRQARDAVEVRLQLPDERVAAQVPHARNAVLGGGEGR